MHARANTESERLVVAKQSICTGIQSSEVTEYFYLDDDRLIRIRTNMVWGGIYKVALIVLRILIERIQKKKNYVDTNFLYRWGAMGPLD